VSLRRISRHTRGCREEDEAFPAQNRQPPEQGAEDDERHAPARYNMTFEVPTTVGAFCDLSGAQEMERLVVGLFEDGNTNRQIAWRLTEMGHRSAQRKHVVRSTVQTVRHRHALIRGARVKGASRAHHIPGRLTLSEVARKFEVPNPGYTTASTTGPSRSSRTKERDSACSPTIRLRSRGSAS
jgi:hypothetical protein